MGRCTAPCSIWLSILHPKEDCWNRIYPGFALNGYVYLFWSESTTGTDTTNVDASPLLGNRVDRYIWNGTTLTFDRKLISLRSLQQDSGQPSRGNHNGGVLRFGHDGKLYIIFGDNGRRGLLQNITSGGPVPDDQFGGPEPDDAHMTGVILRFNDDGTTPSDNPFFNASTSLSGEAAANVKKIFAYGVRNSFGMDVDPLTGNLWTQENGDDSFDEINRVRPGFNGGWIQAIGPINRVAEYKAIESTYGAGNSNNCAGHRVTLRTRHRPRLLDSTCFRARNTSIPNSVGSTPSPHRRSVLCAAGDRARNMKAIYWWALRGRHSRTVICSVSTCRRIGNTLRLVSLFWRIWLRTTE